MNINSSSKPIKNIRAKIKSAMAREDMKNNNTEINRSERASEFENNTNNNHMNYTQVCDKSQPKINLDKLKGIIIFIHNLI